MYCGGAAHRVKGNKVVVGTGGHGLGGSTGSDDGGKLVGKRDRRDRR